MQPKKILVLVSGSGQPRDPQADPQDNSTTLTSLIIGRFVSLCYPEIQVIHVSSSGGMFRCEERTWGVRSLALRLGGILNVDWATELESLACEL
jgi:hypothetical protein